MLCVVEILMEDTAELVADGLVVQGALTLVPMDIVLLEYSSLKKVSKAVKMLSTEPFIFQTPYKHFHGHVILINLNQRATIILLLFC